MKLELRDNNLSEFERSMLSFSKGVPGIGEGLSKLLGGLFGGISDKNEARRLETKFLELQTAYGVSAQMTLNAAQSVLPEIVQRKLNLSTRTDRVGKRYVKALDMLEKIVRQIIQARKGLVTPPTKNMKPGNVVKLTPRSKKMVPAPGVKPTAGAKVSPAKLLVPIAIASILF